MVGDEKERKKRKKRNPGSDGGIRQSYGGPFVLGGSTCPLCAPRSELPGLAASQRRPSPVCLGPLGAASQGPCPWRGFPEAV